MNLTPVLAIQSPMQLSGHRKENQELILNLLVIEITRLSESMHTSLKLTSNEIATISRDILVDYWMLKFEEIILILDKVRKAKNYNRLDQSVIFSFIDDYVAKERQNLLDKARIEEKKQQEADNKEQEAMIRKLYEDVKAGKRKLYNDELNELHKSEKRRIGDEESVKSKKEAEYLIWREQYNKEQQEKEFKQSIQTD